MLSLPCTCCWVTLAFCVHKKLFCIHILEDSAAQDGYLACPDRILPVVYTVLSLSSHIGSDSLKTTADLLPNASV